MKVLENNIDEPNMYCRAQATAAVLVETMDRCGVDKSVVCHVATKEKQHEDLLKFAKAINGDRLISFGSIMPDAQSALEYIWKISDEGLLGVKLHPALQHTVLESLTLQTRTTICGGPWSLDTAARMAQQRQDR